jgi:hypothetical protein
MIIIMRRGSEWNGICSEITATTIEILFPGDRKYTDEKRSFMCVYPRNCEAERIATSGYHGTGTALAGISFLSIM